MDPTIRDANDIRREGGWLDTDESEPLPINHGRGKEAPDGTDEWPEPMPLMRELPPADPYPLEVLPSVLKDAAEVIIEAVQAPVAIVGSSLLAASSLAVQAHANVIMMDGRTIPLSLFMATFGESGERKTAVDDLALASHHKREKVLRQKYEEEMEYFRLDQDAWKKSREEALRKKGGIIEKRTALEDLGPEPPHPLNPILMVGEPTYEGLVKHLDNGWPSIGVFSDEGGRFAGGNGWNNENQIKTASGLSEMWQGKPISRMRSGDGSLVLYGRRVALHLMLQPSLMPLLMGSDQLAGQGFLARLLLSYPESTIGTRRYRAVDLQASPEMRAYRSLMTKVLEVRLPLAEGKVNELEPRSMHLSMAAQNVWCQFHDHVEQLQSQGNLLRPIRASASKAAEQAIRVAGVLALLDDLQSAEVSISSMEAGIGLAKYHLGEALRLNHGSQLDPDLVLAEKVLAWGRKQDEMRFCAVDLYQKGPPEVREKTTARKTMATLVDHGWARPLPSGTVVNGKARREAWEVRP